MIIEIKREKKKKSPKCNLIYGPDSKSCEPFVTVLSEEKRERERERGEEKKKREEKRGREKRK